MMKVIYFIENIGNYHQARLEELNKNIEVVTIEVYRNSSIYSWKTQPDFFKFKNYTLFENIEKNIYAQSRVGVNKINQILHNENPDYLAIPGWGFYYSIAALRWAKKNKKFVIILSDSQEVDSTRKWFQEILKKRYLKYCDGALVAGKPHCKYIKKLGLEEFRIRNSYDVVDNLYFKNKSCEIRNARNIYQEKYSLPKKYFLTVSRLINKKNIPLLLLAYSNYKKMVGNSALDLVIVGDGEQLSKLKILVKELSIENSTYFYGFKKYDEIVVFYALADIFILPSKSEQWGLVINEAMASGLPVLVSDKCGCSDDLVEIGKNGYVFQSESVNDLQKYLFLMTNPATNLKAMGIYSSKIIQEWSLNRFAKNLIQLMKLKPKINKLKFWDDVIFSLMERMLVLKEKMGSKI